MKITKWVDMGAEVDIQIDANDIRSALAEAFEQAEPNLGELPDVTTILRTFNQIGSFLNAFTPEQVALLNPKQRETIHTYLGGVAQKFGKKEFYFNFPDSTDVCGPYPTLEELQADSAWKDPRWKPIWRYKGIPCGQWNEVERA